MSENQSLLSQLEELLTQKKSKKFYAERLGISEFEVNELLKELREKDNDQM
jgi:biotin operon repressor